MDKEFYRRKMATRFATFDYNHDGAVTEADFDQMASNVLGSFNVAAESPEGTAVLNGAVHLWTSLCDAADTNQDGRVSPEEFVRGMTESMFGTRDGFAQAAGPWATAIVAVADTDGAGTLSADAYGRMLRALGAKDEAVNEITSHMTHSDGSVSVDAVLGSALDFYTSDKPYHPATWTFGKF